LELSPKEFFTPKFSHGFIPIHPFIPKIIGMMVIVILALNWLKEKLYKTNSKDKKDSKTKKWNEI